MTKLFVPSSQKLNAMITDAEARFEADRAQILLRKEAEREAFAIRLAVARAKQINARHWFQ